MKWGQPPVGEQCCGNCFYSRPGGDEQLRCHARPPGGKVAWPFVLETDWCGNWATREEVTRPSVRLQQGPIEDPTPRPPYG
jgi:hypothetical protein